MNQFELYEFQIRKLNLIMQPLARELIKPACIQSQKDKEKKCKRP